MNAKKQFAQTVVEQGAFMGLAALALVPALVVSPVTILLRNKREKLPEDQQETHPIARVHGVLASTLVFCAFTLIQGPDVIKGAYSRAYGKAPRKLFKR